MNSILSALIVLGFFRFIFSTIGGGLPFGRSRHSRCCDRRRCHNPRWWL